MRKIYIPPSHRNTMHVLYECDSFYSLVINCALFLLLRVLFLRSPRISSSTLCCCYLSRNCGTDRFFSFVLRFNWYRDTVYSMTVLVCHIFYIYIQHLLKKNIYQNTIIYIGIWNVFLAWRIIGFNLQKEVKITCIQLKIDVVWCSQFSKHTLN